jgi:hypothetical protein
MWGGYIIIIIFVLLFYIGVCTCTILWCVCTVYTHIHIIHTYLCVLVLRKPKQERYICYIRLRNNTTTTPHFFCVCRFSNRFSINLGIFRGRTFNTTKDHSSNRFSINLGIFEIWSFHAPTRCRWFTTRWQWWARWTCFAFPRCRWFTSRCRWCF